MPKKQNLSISGQKPNKGLVKLNCDASQSKEDLSTGIGVVARDFAGIVIGGVRKYIKCDYVLLVEGLAMTKAIYLVKSNRWTSIILDSL